MLVAEDSRPASPESMLPAMAWVDLHCHVLPGLDDGPGDRAASEAMLDRMAEQGIAIVVATPHVREDFPDVTARRIREEVAALGERSGPRVVTGGEIAITRAMAMSDEELRALSIGGHGRDLLIETPYGPLSSWVEDAVLGIAARGFRVVLAHPELNPSFQRSPRRLARLVAGGVLLQVTAASLLRSRRRSPSARLAEELVRDGIAPLLASDAHSAGPWRPPELTAGVLAATRLAGARGEWMASVAPAAVLAGAPLPAPPRAGATPRGLARLRRRAATV